MLLKSYKKPILISTIIAIIIVFILILYIISNHSEPRFGSIKVGDPEITVFYTAENKTNLNEYYPKTEFFISDTVYVHQEYRNISVYNNSFDVYANLSVTNEEVTYYFQEINITYIEYGRYWFFYTNNWPAGNYNITVYLEDKLTNKSTTAKTNFTLINSR